MHTFVKTKSGRKMFKINNIFCSRQISKQRGHNHKAIKIKVFKGMF